MYLINVIHGNVMLSGLEVRVFHIESLLRLYGHKSKFNRKLKRNSFLSLNLVLELVVFSL